MDIHIDNQLRVITRRTLASLRSSYQANLRLSSHYLLQTIYHLNGVKLLCQGSALLGQPIRLILLFAMNRLL